MIFYIKFLSYLGSVGKSLLRSDKTHFAVSLTGHQNHTL